MSIDKTQTTDNAASDEAELQQMLEAAAAIDAGKEFATPADANAAKPEDKPDDSKPADDKKTGDAAPAKDDKKETPDKTAKPDDKKGEEKPEDKKPESKFAAAKKKEEAERVRLNNSWKELEAQKQAFREEQERIKAEAAKATPKKPDAATQEAIKKAEADAAAYEGVAKDYDAEGDTEAAKIARTEAAALRKKAEELKGTTETKTAAAQGVSAANTPEFQAQWKANVQTLFEKYPQYRDEKNPVHQIFSAILKNKAYQPLLFSHPSGVLIAAEIAGYVEKAKQADTLTAELTEAKATIEKLNRQLGLSTTPGAKPPAETKKDVLNLSDEEFARLAMSDAAAVDRAH